MPMKWFQRLFERRGEPVTYPELVPEFSQSGAIVTPANAESISACFACVQAISESVASLPLITYRRTDGGDRERAADHPLYQVLHDRPNPRQTSLEFREQMQAAVLLRGNGYAEIEFDGQANVTALHPIHPDRVTVLKLNNDRIGYDVADDNGQVRRLLQEEVFHLKDRTENGITGRSRIRIARDTLGLAISQQDHGAKTFANGTRLSGVLQTPHQMNDEALKRLSKSWRSQFQGADNAGKTAILENGLEYKQMSMSLEDAEWLAAMKFSVEQVCRIFRVPPTMAGDLTHGNYSNTSETARHFVIHTLKRHLVMWEQAISRALLGPIARQRYFAEHSLDGLLRGDSTNRAEFYKLGIESGWLLPSEARRLENLPTVEGIDDARTVQAA
jgi:HK97 family phage portal protein